MTIKLFFLMVVKFFCSSFYRYWWKQILWWSPFLMLAPATARVFLYHLFHHFATFKTTYLIVPLHGKLMQSNRLSVWNRFKSDSNWLLIDISDPKSSTKSIKISGTIQIWIQILNPNSIYINNWSNLIKNWLNLIENWLNLIKNWLNLIENRSNLIEIGWKWPDFVIFDINWLLIDYSDLLDLFYDLLIEIDWIKIKKDQF